MDCARPTHGGKSGLISEEKACCSETLDKVLKQVDQCTSKFLFSIFFFFFFDVLVAQ